MNRSHVVERGSRRSMTGSLAKGSRMSLARRNELLLERIRLREDLKDRCLERPFAHPVTLWGFLVGIAISGEVFGWNLALRYGWYNFILATFFSIVMFWSVVDVSNRTAICIPFTNGLPSLCTSIFGEGFSTFVCLMIAISFALLVAQNAIALGSYISEVLHAPSYVAITLWLIVYFISYSINVNQRIFFKFITVLSFFSVFTLLLIVAVNMAASIYNNDFHLENTFGNTKPLSLVDFSSCVPMAIWWFLGIEAISMASEEVCGYTKYVYRSSNLAMMCLTALAIIIAVFGPMFSPYEDISHTEHPLFKSFVKLYGIDHSSVSYRILLIVVLLPPILASTVGGIYATSRKIYSLSRMSLLPRQLSITRSGSPIFSIMATCAFSFAVSLTLKLFIIISGADPEIITIALVKIPAFTSIVSYLCIGLIYIVGRLQQPHLFYKSSIFGYFSALCSLFCSTMVLVFFLYEDSLFYGVCLGVTGALLLSTVFFEHIRGHTPKIGGSVLYIRDVLNEYTELKNKEKQNKNKSASISIENLCEDVNKSLD